MTMLMMMTMTMLMMMLMTTKYPKCKTSSAGFVEKGEKIMRVWTYVVWNGGYLIDYNWTIVILSQDSDDTDSQ